jgi:hypothetical protein
VVGHSGSIAGFHTIVLADEDGHRRFALMTNQYLHGAATAQAFNQAALALMRDLLPDTCSSVVAGRTLADVVGAALHPATAADGLTRR